MAKKECAATCVFFTKKYYKRYINKIIPNKQFGIAICTNAYLSFSCKKDK